MASLTLNCHTHEALLVQFHSYLVLTMRGSKKGIIPQGHVLETRFQSSMSGAPKEDLTSSQVDGHEKIMVEKRLWCDYPHKTRKITEEDLMLLAEKICLALECIERSLSIRNRRLGKKPINIPKITEFTLGCSTLERSCREFLDLEYFAKRQEMFQHYALLPCQRVASGRSLIFECLSAEEFDHDFVVTGKLIYDGLGLPKSECMVNACRVKGSDDSGSGDWMVATEIRLNDQGQFEEIKPKGTVTCRKICPRYS